MSFYTSLTGLNNAQTNLDVISNNIANADTGGFKRSSASFADLVSTSMLTDPSLTVGNGARVSSISQQFSLGSMQQTGNTLDLAINGDGMFTVKSTPSNDISYTRSGSFSVDGSGYVRNSQNEHLQVFPVNASGTITSTTTVQDAVVPLTNTASSTVPAPAYTGASVGADGKLTASYADGSTVVIGVVALANFSAPQSLRQIGNASWVPTGLSGAATYGQPNVGDYGPLLSGTLEGSNVDLSTELVNLIAAQRSFQANAKAIDATTQITQTIINLRTS